MSDDRPTFGIKTGNIIEPLRPGLHRAFSMAYAFPGTGRARYWAARLKFRNRKMRRALRTWSRYINGAETELYLGSKDPS